MEYEIQEHPSVRVVRFDGDLGSYDEPALKKVFVTLRGEGVANVVLDLSQVAFLDSTTLGTLVWALKNFREAGGDLRLAGLQGFVQNLFEMTELHRAFRTFETAQEAIDSYGR